MNKTSTVDLLAINKTSLRSVNSENKNELNHFSPFEILLL